MHFRNLDTQALQVGPSFLGVKKERPAITQPHHEIEHGASSRNSQAFTPVPVTPVTYSYLNQFLGNKTRVKKMVKTGTLMYLKFCGNIIFSAGPNDKLCLGEATGATGMDSNGCSMINDSHLAVFDSRGCFGSA